MRKFHDLVLTFKRNRDGVAAVEFAFVAPMLFVLMVGIVVVSLVLNTYSSLQQIAAEAARAALPGQSAAQQSQLVSQYVSSVIGNYSFLDPTKLSVSTTSTSNTLSVALTYDTSGAFFRVIGTPSFAAPTLITRTATVQLSGF